MEDVSFGYGTIIFVNEFQVHAVVGRTLRLVGRLIAYDAARQIATLADPDDDDDKIRVNTSLLVEVKPVSGDGIVAIIGEVCIDNEGLCFKPRVFSQIAKDFNFQLFKRMVLRRRATLAQQGFS